MIGRPRKKIEIDVAFNPELMERFVDTLLEKKKVTVAGLGNFVIVPIKSRYLYHNFSDRNIRTSKSVKIRFVPIDSLKKLCQTLI